VLKQHLRITVQTLLGTDTPQREIARRTGVDRKTIRSYARAMANSPGVATGFSGAAAQIPPPWPPAPEDAPGTSAPAAASCATSACEPHRSWIEAQVALGRNAVIIYLLPPFVREDLAHKKLEGQAGRALTSCNGLHKPWREPGQFHEFVRPHLLHALALGDFGNAPHCFAVESFLPVRGHAQRLHQLGCVVNPQLTARNTRTYSV